MDTPIGPVHAEFPCCEFPCGSHLSSGVAVTLILIEGSSHEPYLETAWFHYFLVFCTRTEQVTGIAFLTVDSGHPRAVPPPSYVPVSYMPTVCPLLYNNLKNIKCIVCEFLAIAEQLKITQTLKSWLLHKMWHALLGSAEAIPTSSNRCKPLSTPPKALNFSSFKVPVTALLCLDC